MSESPPKIRIMPGARSDLSAATYQIHNESHTLGNALRWMLMKNPKVEFCGYRYNLSSLTALLCALDDLDALFGSIEDAYKASLGHDAFTVWDETR
ncbi:hypothetical protein BC826DRAFT_1091312 [Russula brevipes]|nr:hypothetical protein BC826DRAFT_1091312 [Russula brevipes]